MTSSSLKHTFFIFLMVMTAACGSSSDEQLPSPSPAGTFEVLVFGKSNPEYNQDIVDFLNGQSDITATTTANLTDITLANLQAYDVVIDFDENTVPDTSGDITPDQEQALLDYVRSGGKLIGLHHSIYDPLDQLFIIREIFGAYLPYHCCQVEPDPYDLIMVQPTNAVFDGLPTTGTIEYSSALVPAGNYPYYELPILDERYTEIVFLDGKGLTILLSTIFNGTSYDIGWFRAEGSGIVFYYQPGHLREMFSVPWYQQLIINTIRYEY